MYIVRMIMFGRIFMMGIFIVFYTGCTTKDEILMEKSFAKTTGSSTLMQKTEKIKIGENNEVKISLAVTYLNDEESIMDEKNLVREKFIVNIYRSDAVSGTGLIDEEQKLTINIQYPESDKEFNRAEKIERDKGIDRLPLKIKKLSLSDPLLKNVPMLNGWNSYYYVEFPHTRRKRFTLVYQNKRYGQKAVSESADKTKKPVYTKYRLNFTKREKYLYQKQKNFF